MPRARSPDYQLISEDHGYKRTYLSTFSLSWIGGDDSTKQLEDTVVDYGFYTEDDSEDFKINHHLPALTPYQVEGEKEDNLEKKILCIVQNGNAPLSCRSFGKLGQDDSLIVIKISMPEFRIVSAENENFVEYKVQFSVEGHDIIAWRRYSEFEMFAEAFVTVSASQCPKDPNLLKIVHAWQEVVRNRPWFPMITNVFFLLGELSLLENFLQTALFELPHFSLFEEFVR